MNNMRSVFCHIQAPLWKLIIINLILSLFLRKKTGLGSVKFVPYSMKKSQRRKISEGVKLCESCGWRTLLNGSTGAAFLTWHKTSNVCLKKVCGQVTRCLFCQLRRQLTFGKERKPRPAWAQIYLNTR
jgi:hypothetical protein